MSDDRCVTVLVSIELLAELHEWSQPVQVMIQETPRSGTGYDLIARAPLSYEAHIDGAWVHLHPADVRIVFPGDPA